MRRGITLVEVVAASALLTLIVLACVPVLRGSRADLAAARSVAEHQIDRELEAAVDELLRQHPGLAELALEQPEGIEQRWTVGDREYAAIVRVGHLVRVREDEPRSSHAWLLFTMNGVGVEIPRWVRVEAAPESLS